MWGVDINSILYSKCKSLEISASILKYAFYYHTMIVIASSSTVLHQRLWYLRSNFIYLIIIVIWRKISTEWSTRSHIAPEHCEWNYKSFLNDCRLVVGDFSQQFRECAITWDDDGFWYFLFMHMWMKEGERRAMEQKRRRWLAGKCCRPWGFSTTTTTNDRWMIDPHPKVRVFTFFIFLSLLSTTSAVGV